MCLLFFYLNDNPELSDYKLIVASNREEFWVRPTDTAKLRGDNQQWLGGIDLEPGREGGTWLGLSTSGRFGALLNILIHHSKEKRGRGNLVKDWVCGNQSCKEYMEKIGEEKSHYNPFLLVAIDLRETPAQAHYLENANSTDKVFPPGVYSFDNSDDHTNLWKKTADGETKFTSIVSEHGRTPHRDTLVDRIYDLLNDKSQFFPDEQLIKQYSNRERATEGEVIEQTSARFVFSPLIKFGTRTNTIILVDFHGNCEYLERTLETPVNIENPQWTTVEHKLKLTMNH